MTLLRVENLVKYYNVRGGLLSREKRRLVHAVDDVSFELNRGESVALIGESGCGKSSLANLVLGLSKPTRGRIIFEGEDVAGLAGAAWRNYRRNVQAVFQDPWSSLDPRWKVERLIMEPMTVSGVYSVVEARKRVPELLREVGLEPSHGNRFPHQFSGGQRQRIAIACAIAAKPRIIILDEPVSALDVSVRASILKLLRQLQDDHGIAYLFISHDVAAVNLVADRTLVMYLGEIVEAGPTEPLLRDPIHPYTQALLSASHALEISKNPEMEWRDLPLLKGDLPSSIDPPSGCRFRSRCRTATEVSSEDRPRLTGIGQDRFVAACQGCVGPRIEALRAEHASL